MRGATMMEYALIAPLLFTLIYVTIEMSLMMWVNLTMQYAVREGVRYGIVAAGDGSVDETAHVQNVIRTIRDNSMGFYDKLNPVYKVSLNGGPATTFLPGTTATGMFGGGGDIVKVQIDCEWHTLTPVAGLFVSGGVYRFSAATTMRNEER